MINGQITLQGFHADVVNGEIGTLADGKPTGEKVPIKILQFKDEHGASEVRIVFLPGQIEQFAEWVSQKTSNIVRPGADLKSFLTRNGGIRG